MEKVKARPVRFVGAAVILGLSSGHNHGSGPISHNHCLSNREAGNLGEDSQEEAGLGVC
jgi:hypothetical protein